MQGQRSHLGPGIKTLRDLGRRVVSGAVKKASRWWGEVAPLRG